MEKGFIIITENELTNILNDVFIEGALSYSNWQGQRDTLWSNIDYDKKEYVLDIIKKLSKKSE